MNSKNKISLGFSLIILLLAILGIASIFEMHQLATATDNLYKHPFAVSNAVKNIKINVLTIRLSLENMVLAKEPKEIKQLIAQIEQNDMATIKEFDIVFDRFLGNITAVKTLQKHFITWRHYRHDIITEIKKGNQTKALNIIQNRGEKHFVLLNQEALKLLDYANNKAETFYLHAQENKRHSFIIIGILLSIIILISISVSIYVLENLANSQHEINRTLNLIDQNVMIAQLDPSGKIGKISHALCRQLGATQQDLIGQSSNFFVPHENTRLFATIHQQLLSGAPWTGEIQYKNSEDDPLWLYSTIQPIYAKDDFKITGYSNIIENITNKKAVEELSITDQLTGLHNRRLLKDVLEVESRHAKRQNTSISMVILDIDFFKLYNDHYGHPAGDQALVNVAQVLQNTLQRPDDHAFRLGGEEFCLVFSKLDQQKTFDYLETIRQKIEALQIKHEYSNVSKYLTVSIGASVHHGRNVPHYNLLYEETDKLLYQAKQQRNTVIVDHNATVKSKTQI